MGNININELEKNFINEMGRELPQNNKIEPSLYSKYQVKRGLRDNNGAGVVVGLTNIGDVQGYRVNEDNIKVPIDGKLFYRGIDVEDIVENCMKSNRFGFEETSYLLLFGTLPDKKKLDTFCEILGSKRSLPIGFARDIVLTAPSRSVMNKLATSVLSLYSYDPDPDNCSLKNVLRQSIDLIGYFPSLMAYAYQAKYSHYDNKNLHLQYPDPSMSTAENILRLIRPGGEFTDIEAKLLDISMILHAEHGGGNNSSFTTHLVSSTGTDTYSAISAAIGSLKGPKHGGANLAVIGMMKDIHANVKDITDFKEVENYLRKILAGKAGDGSGLIYGLGHAVYTVSDPRAILLKKMAKQLAIAENLLDEFMLYDFIEKRAPILFMEAKGTEKPMPANVDLYSGFVYNALNIPIDIATPLFATARLSGWCAHRIEEIVAGGKIMRPAYKCIMQPKEYIDLEKR